jgi:GntR family transcriptional regulator
MWKPTIRPSSPLPIYEQIVESAAIAIAKGDLLEGDAVPSVRGLAAELRVNPNTAAHALRELEELGLVAARQGAATVVAKRAEATARRRARQALDRELDSTVGVAIELGIELDELLDSLRRRFGEGSHAARA